MSEQVQPVDVRANHRFAPTSPTRREWLSIFILCIAVVIAALPVLTYPLGRDQGEFATIARGMLDGRVPYTELWNPKPPAVFILYAGAIALFGRTAEAIRLLDLLVIPPTLIALWWIGRRIMGHFGGILAAAIFALSYFNESFWTLTQNDGLVLLPMALAVVCLFKTADHGKRSWLWALLCGMLCGVVVWFKYPFALFVGGIVTGYVLLPHHPRPLSMWRGAAKHAQTTTLIPEQPPTDIPPLHMDEGLVAKQPWGEVLAFIFGLALILIGGALRLMALGAWDAFVESARVTAGYTTLTLNIADIGAALATALGYRWAHWGIAVALGGIGLIRLWRNQNIDRAAWTFLLLWLVAGAGIMLIQAKGYDYHWLPMLPPLALLAGFGLSRFFPEKSPKRWGKIEDSNLDPDDKTVLEYNSENWATRTIALPSKLVQGAKSRVILVGALIAIMGGVLYVRTLPYLFGAEDRLTYFSRFQGGEFVADESERMAQFLRERVVTGDSLFIWGFRPEVYYLSGLNPAVRFIFQYPLVGEWYPAAWQQETVEILWAALPPYVLVMQVDYMPWVTGSHEDSNTLLQQYTELNNWLIYNYAHEAQIGNFLIWRRTS